MSDQYLVYWNWEENNPDNWDGPIVSAASAYYSRVSRGDILWITTMRNDASGRRSGKLILLGRMRVAEVLTPEETLRKWPNLLYSDTKLHAIADPSLDEPLRQVDIADLAFALRFQGEHDRLTPNPGGGVSPGQLQNIRLLTPEAVRLLEAVWLDDTSEPSGGPIPLTEDDDGFPEGSRVLRQHLKRERNRELVALAKRLFKERYGRLFCQACGFDFTQRYGELGADYIEAHHTLPVSQMDEGHRTRIEDLAMVCSNCHRMLHRRRPWLGMADLKKILASPPQ